MKNPYDRLPREEIGDRSSDDVYLAVGRALSSWEALETALANLFSILMASNIYSTDRVFGAVVASSTRLDMIAAASEIFFYYYKDQHTKIKKLVHLIKEFSGRRNEIAHGIVIMIIEDDKDVMYYLFPSGYSSKKWDVGFLTPLYAYNSKQISFYESEFDKLTRAVYRKADAIHKWALKQPSKQIPPLNPHTHGLLHPQALSQPHQSSDE